MLASHAPPRDDDDPEVLWRALASPVRRRILDALRAGPRTTGELDEVVPELSRYAVMQHLEVLVHAGVVLVERRGRQRFNYLNPVALRTFYERWVTRYADATARELTALRRHLEEEPAMPTPAVDTVRILRLEAELRFRAPPERVFRAMSDPDEIARWFPATYGGDRVQRIVLEGRVGGLQYEDWGDGRGHLYGQVTDWDPPHRFGVRSRLHPGTIMDTTVTVAADGDGSVLRSSRVIVGPISEDEAAAIVHHGDLRLFEDAIRAVVEGS
jgi:uncharacterized protein YndB with AHSA1/START domain/DNA-binding transcriptional ArsR family regulator